MSSPRTATSQGAPSLAQSTPPRHGRYFNALLAALGGAVAIAAAALFSTKPPAPMPPPRGITVDDQSVTLAANAPQWNVLRLAQASAPRAIYSDPVPARVRIDETVAARVGSPLAGRVNSVFVELGQKVKKGQPLFTVASGELPTLRGDLAKATVDLELARAQYQRVHDMVAARLMPGKEELAAAAQKREAELAQQAARSRLDALRIATTKNDSEFKVTAPRDGVVVEKSVLPAQEVDSNTTLMQIADVSNVWVFADLFESDAAGITVGTPARVILPALPGSSIDATVDAVSAVVDPERHSVPVRVRLSNSDARLKPNQYAEMRFQMTIPDSTSEISVSALVSDGATQYVYVQEQPGKLVKRQVVAGPVRDGRVL
ncbi:MAG: efflux RND transporter periplasmic adaptor subunit, partial [Polyangiales bacterium]